MSKTSLKETYAQHKIGKLQMNIYESSNDIPYHWHDEYEFLYITDGECECIINGKSIIVKEGQAILISGGELHTVNQNTSGQFFAVVFHPYIIFGTEFNNFFSKKISYNRIFEETSSSGKQITQLLNLIHSYFYNQFYGFELTLKALIIEIFATIYEHHLYSFNEKKDANDFDRFADIIEYIHDNFAEKLSLEHVANYAHFSKSYLIRLLKKNTGKTFSTYLNCYRIYRAIDMLENTDKNILEISEECGFGNVVYFIKVFKQNIGVTPHKYRKN